MTLLENNIREVHKKIDNACKRVGRSPEEVTLICVSKTVSPPVAAEAFSLGEKVFGENRVSELCLKEEFLPEACWHLIGHLQTNKVKNVVGKARLIHSVDSLHLAQAISSAAEKKGISQDILLEVNISGEESKYGLTIEEIPTIIKNVESLPAISFKGFMTMAPLFASEEEIRALFRRAHSLFEQYSSHGAEILSMGMSNDFEIAVEEGATHIRVGRSIFGGV